MTTESSQSNIPQIPTSMFPRRHENASDLEKCFNERVLKIFAENKIDDLTQFRKDIDIFLIALKTEFLWGLNGKTKYVTLTRLFKILKTSPPTIRETFSQNIVFTLVKITNFNLAIDIVLIEALVQTVIHAEDTYIKLVPFCENSREISACGLQDFVTQHYIPQMAEMPERTDYYAAYAVEIIFFLLEARRREVIFVKDLLSSALLLNMEACIKAEKNGLELPENDIFTLSAFRSTLHEFRSLDADRNGVLTEDELLDFRNGGFNGIFIKRVFEISLTYEGACLDFKGFVDLVCAVRFRHTRASAKYHFEALDLKEDGVLDEDEIRTMATAVRNYNPDDPQFNVDCVTAEMQDMLRAKKTISLSEFLDSKMGPVFTGYVSNFADFIKYERREQ
uniref:EF-hand domain-containing protein n=1 Tax=Caenorhabditis japonica TaxID=281687 RepID=A0A8R1HNV5_CAEJA